MSFLRDKLEMSMVKFVFLYILFIVVCMDRSIFKMKNKFVSCKMVFYNRGGLILLFFSNIKNFRVLVIF